MTEETHGSKTGPRDAGPGPGKDAHPHHAVNLGHFPLLAEHTEEDLSLDDVLQADLKEFGRGQQRMLLVGGLAFLATGILMFLMTFTQGTRDPTTDPTAWRCVKPAEQDPVCHAAWLSVASLSSSKSSNSSAGEAETRLSSSSNSNNVSDSTSLGEEGVGRKEGLCSLRPAQYEWTQRHLTMQTSYNLVCDNAWKVEFLDTLFFVGFMLGNGILGRAADKYGRRSVAYGGAVGVVVLTLLAALAPNFWLHLLLRVLSGSCGAGMCLAGYVIVSECVGPTWRGTAGMLVQTFYILGEMILAGLAAWLMPYGWRLLTAAVGVAPLLVLATWRWVPESPRWLLTQGRDKEARAALQWLAQANGTQLKRMPSMRRTGSSIRRPDAAELEAFRAQYGPVGEGSSGAEVEMGRAGSDVTRNPAAGLGVGSLSTPHVAAAVEAERTEDAAPLFAAVLQSGGTEVCLDKSSDVSSVLKAEVWLPDGCSCQAAKGQGAAEGGAEVDERAGLLGEQSQGSSHASTSPTAAQASSGHDGGDEAAEQQEETLMQVVRSPMLGRLFFFFLFIMFTLSVAYFGVSLALGTLAGDLRVNFLLTALAELPAYLIIAATVEKLGRKMVVGSGVLIAGLSCTALATIAPRGAWQIVLAMAGKFGCSSAWALGITYASELFPTSCRSAAVGAVSQAGDFGGILAPQLLLLANKIHFRELPFLVMGLTSLVASALVLMLPETRGMQQADTVAELHRILKDHKAAGQQRKD